MNEPHLRPEFVWLGWQISCNICLKIISSPIYHWWDNACALAKSGHICGNVPPWCPVLYIQGPPCMAISSTFPIYINLWRYIIIINVGVEISYGYINSFTCCGWNYLSYSIKRGYWGETLWIQIPFDANQSITKGLEKTDFGSIGLRCWSPPQLQWWRFERPTRGLKVLGRQTDPSHLDEMSSSWCHIDGISEIPSKGLMIAWA